MQSREIVKQITVGSLDPAVHLCAMKWSTLETFLPVKAFYRKEYHFIVC